MLKNTDNKYKNTAFWSWNGVIEEDEALFQLSQLKDKGYGGAFIHARAGLGIPYMGQRWFEVYDACVRWAGENDFDIWIYDEYGWPSGFSGGKVNGLGEDYQIKRIVTSESPIQDEKHRFLSSYQGEYGEIYLYYVCDRNYVDLMDPKVTKEFIACVHQVYYDRYKPYFGNVIKGIFTDEPQLALNYPWSPALEEAYVQEYGESLVENLWRLFLENPQGDQLRARYYDLVARQFTEAFVRPIAGWCEDHGVLFTGHFAEEDGLTGQYRANGGVMAKYYEMQQPGIDFLGRRLCSPVLGKQIASVKNQFNKDTVISETFGCTGWSTTFAQLLWIWGYQASFGINKACLHLSAYSIKGIRKRDYPAFFSYQEPWWEIFGAVSDKMAEINAFVSQGSSINDILLLSPIQSLYGLKYGDAIAKKISAQFRNTVQTLLDRQYSFDLGDETLLERFGAVEDGVLHLGQGKYSYLVIPECISLQSTTYRLLERFVRQGGKVLYINSYPKMIGETAIGAEEKAVFSKGYLCANWAGLIEKYFNAMGYRRAAWMTDDNGMLITEDLALHISKENDRTFIFIQNLSKTNTVCGWLNVSGAGSFREERLLPARAGLGVTGTRLALSPMENRCILFTEGERAQGNDLRLLHSQLLQPVCARLMDQNAYNIDRAFFETEGFTSELLDTALLQDGIAKHCAGHGGACPVTVVYPFRIDAPLPQLQVAVETGGALRICFNGRDITDRFSSDYYVDKSILLAQVEDLQQLGENRLTVDYLVAERRTYDNTLESFETERNIFSYRSEAESVYLLGDFSVATTGTLWESHCLTVNGGEFSLTTGSKVNLSEELTHQGLWFYRGRVKYTYNVCREKGMQYRLHFEDFQGVAAKIVCGEKEKVLLHPAAGVDITQLLEEGENLLEVTLYSSNRNLLGPFHHQSGEPLFVGNSTFRGVKGFEDSILYRHFGPSTYDPDYHFVRLGIGRAILSVFGE